MKNKLKIIGILIGTVMLLYIYKYIFNTYNIGIPCIFHEITHLYCPGCGITRALFALLELNISKALKQNVLIIFLPFLIIYAVNYLRIKINKKNEDPSKIFPKIIWYIFIIITIMYGILRNYLSFLQPS